MVVIVESPELSELARASGEIKLSLAADQPRTIEGESATGEQLTSR